LDTKDALRALALAADPGGHGRCIHNGTSVGWLTPAATQLELPLPPKIK